MFAARSPIERPVLDQRAERLTLGVLHDEVAQALRRDPHVERAHHVRVAHPAGELRLALEPQAVLLVVEHPPVQHLDGQLAADLHVLGAEHRSHGAGAQPLDDAVARGEDLPEQAIDVGLAHGPSIRAPRGVVREPSVSCGVALGCPRRPQGR